MSEFSIAIPTHDRGENGPKWLRELFESGFLINDEFLA